MRISDWSSDVCSSDLVRAEHGAEPTKSALRSPTTYLTQWRVADSRAESMRMRSGAEIARYDRTACSIAGHRANEWAGCASRSEEHTSELQSLMAHLVCRLLLEKTNKIPDKIKTVVHTN